MIEHDILGDLRGFHAELVRVRTTALQNLSLGTQIRDRIVERLVHYLRENVSADEAEKAFAIGGAVDLFGSDEIDAIDEQIAYLEALIADLSAGHPPSPTRTPVPMQREIARLQLHSRVIEVASQLFSDGHYRQAVLDTYIALVEQVKLKSGLPLDNTPLMQQAFSPDKPRLQVSADKDEQLGFMWLFSGAVMAIRNPKAHRLMQQQDPQRTLEWLCFASALFCVLDGCSPSATSA